MSNKQIKKRIEQEAERYHFHNEESICKGDAIDCFHAAIEFYEQSILPEVLKEKDAEIARLKMLADRYRKISYELDPKFKQYEGQMSPNDKPTQSTETGNLNTK
jgi:hypothetical protein